MGFLSVALALCTEGLKSWKNSIARSIIHDGAPHGILRAAIFHSGYSTGLILIGSCLVSRDVIRICAAHGYPYMCRLSNSWFLMPIHIVADFGVHFKVIQQLQPWRYVVQAQFWAPAAAAAGVSLVMAYLNGVAIPDLLSLQTLIAKWASTKGPSLSKTCITASF